MNDEPPSSPQRDRALLHGVDWAVRAGVTEEVVFRTRQRVRRRRQRRLAAMSTLVVCLLLAAAWIPRGAKPPATPAAARASVAVSVPARQTLDDGTLVELREGARISVAFSPGIRRVTLLDGEAHFQVVRDPARPFVVSVDSVAVRAVGTAFSVDRRQSEVEVLVTHGRVAVERVTETGPGAASAAPLTIATLDAGNCTRVEASPLAATPAVEAVSPSEMHRRLAWRVARLEFSSTPLDEAIPMINEHSAVKLSLGDAALGSVRISGLLRADNVEALFRLLEVEHRIRVEQKSPTEVVLKSGR